MNMKDYPRFQITSKQFLFFVLGSTVGMGILALPRNLSADAGQDAWIAVILGSSAPIVSLFLIERLGKMFKNLTIIEIAPLLFGKYIGHVVGAGFIIYTIFFASIVLRLGTEITSIYALPMTPLSVTAFLIMIVVIYIAQKGLKVIGRLNELLFYIVLFALLLVIPSIKLFDYTNILPVGESGLREILKATLPSSYAYAGIELLLVTYPMVTRKDEILKAGMTALGIVLALYLIVTVTCVLVFGAEALQEMIWPALVLFKSIDIPVLERLEFFFLALWIPLLSRLIINICSIGSISLTQLLKLNISKYYSSMVIVIGAAIYVLALIPDNIVQAFKLSAYGGYGFLLIGIGYPLLFHLAAFLRKGKVKNYG